ncbi:203_t:CDS:2, partial [Acaulospora colombiana]
MSDNIAVPSSVVGEALEQGYLSPAMSHRYPYLSPAQVRLPDSYRSGNRSLYGSYIPSSVAPSLAPISGSDLLENILPSLERRQMTNYTAKVLVKCLEYDENLHTYADMGAIAFGEGVRLIISILFSLELLASAVAVVILVGDSLHTIFPDVSLTVLKLIAWGVMAPLTLMAIRYLSYFSLLGIVSAISLIFVLIIDGFTKTERPGSLIDPMPTELFPTVWSSVPMSFGLIMAGFT